MKAAQLIQYEEAERQFVRDHGSGAAPNGYVSSIEPIYSDKQLPNRVGFHRAGSPLSALLLLYEATVVYVPPAPMSALERRLGMTWNDFIEIANRGHIRPIVGHPIHYARRGHFDQLFEIRPPSVWARGDELAHQFADASEHWDRARALVPAQRMASTPSMRAKYKRHFPGLRQAQLEARIAEEIWTNYVDLCIYGYQPLADLMGTLSDLEHGAMRIMQLSELLTYPSLVGMGGIPNYGVADAGTVEAVREELLLRGPVRMRQFGPELEILTSGIQLSVPDQISPEMLGDFHDDNMARHMWRALAALETRVVDDVDDLGDVAVVAEKASEAVKEGLRQVSLAVNSGLPRRRGRNRRLTDMALKTGSGTALSVAAHQVLGLDWGQSLLAGAGLAQGLWSYSAFPEAVAKAESIVSERLMRREFGDLAAQLWWLVDWQRRQD